MDTIMAIIGITIAALTVCWVCYTRITARIIEDQKREIQRLKAELHRVSVRGGYRKGSCNVDSLSHGEQEIFFGD